MGSDQTKALHSAGLLALRLSEVVPLSPSETLFLTGLKQRSECYSPGSEISSPYEPRIRPSLIVSGWAARQRILSNGRCQLLSLLLPGDTMGGYDENRPLDNESIVAINSVNVVSLKPVLDAISGDPDAFRCISQGLQIMAQSEEHRIINSLVRLGCQSAIERTANIILELFERCKSIKFIVGDSFVMPLTQEMLGNYLGLSVVHVNRIIGQLKRNRWLSLNSNVTIILDHEALRNLADASHGSPYIGRVNESLAPSYATP
jgi:CRP-like cAMP-binding protein